MRFYDDQCYVKSAEEMTELFRPHSLEAGTNTVALAARVEPETIVHGGLERLRLARKDYIPLHGVWE